MTTTLDRHARRTSGRRRRRRRNIVRNITIAVVAMVAITAFLLGQELLRAEPPRTLTVVAFEPRDDADSVAPELAAQIDHVISQGGDLWMAAILDGRDGVVADVSFYCDPGENRLACENHRTNEADEAQAAIEQLLAAPTFPTVAPLSPLRHIETRLVDADGARENVEVILNLTARHTTALDPDGEGVHGRVDELAAHTESAALLPNACDGWRVHIVAPSTGDPQEDRAWEEVYRSAIGSCGGQLVRLIDRWPTAAGTIPPPPPPPEPDEGTVQRDIEGRKDTYSLEQTLFDVGSATLRPGAERILDTIANYLTELEGDWHVKIVGTADSVGDDAMNLELSEDRANSVADALLSRLEGTAADGTTRRDLGERFEIEGIGSLPDDGTDEDRQRNRRVDIIIHHATSELAP